MLLKKHTHTTFSKGGPVSAESPCDFWFLVVPSPQAPPFRKQPLLAGWDRLRSLRRWVADFQSPAHTPSSNVTSSVKPYLTLLLPPASCPGRPGRMSHFLCTLLLPAHFCSSFCPTGNGESLPGSIWCHPGTSPRGLASTPQLLGAFGH